MQLGSVPVPEKIAVVAEIGNNHEGSLETARELVRAAAAAGAHAVKFQAIEPTKLVRSSEHDRITQLERFALSPADFIELAALARSCKVGFCCTPFFLDAVNFLEPLVDAFKIASGDNDFERLLAEVATTGKPVLISTGMSEPELVERAIDAIRQTGDRSGHQPEVAVLHCVSAYPTEPHDAALATIPTLAARTGCVVGYSDHVLGIEASVAAAAAGARIIEKHFTLDHAFSDFRDHQLSADPAEFTQLVERIIDVEALLGRPRDGLISAEVPVAQSARRSAVAARTLARGHRISAGDVVWLRPGDGVRPGESEKLIGRCVGRDVTEGEVLRESDVC